MRILGEKVKSQNNSFKSIIRYVEGIHPGGKVVKGLTGWETAIEMDVIVPIHVFKVIEEDERHNCHS